MVGTIEVTALNDGVVSYKTAELLPTLSAEEIRTRLFEAGLSDPVAMSYTAYLVNTGDRLVLIDTGTGGKLDDSPYFRGAGHVLANLRAAGYQPEQVQEIYITHLGPDHVGGLSQGADRVFPNARLRASAREVAIFMQRQSPEVEAKDWRLKFWRDLFDPYLKAGKFIPFEQDTVLVPGVRSMFTYGHTRGHTSYLVESAGESLLILGDLVLVGALQFERPALETPYDVDRPAGAATRERIMRMAAAGDWWIAGSHLSFPGIGKVRAGTAGYRFLPVNYLKP
jgi:glyoxylase-like metal-dependent hydrolase (beta-lactamase superfamily II)